MIDKPTHTPEALYSCYVCREDVSWPAGDLNWCDKVSQWMCDCCWDYEEHGEKGIRLDHHLMKGRK